MRGKVAGVKFRGFERTEQHAFAAIGISPVRAGDVVLLVCAVWCGKTHLLLVSLLPLA